MVNTTKSVRDILDERIRHHMLRVIYRPNTASNLTLFLSDKISNQLRKPLSEYARLYQRQNKTT